MLHLSIESKQKLELYLNLLEQYSTRHHSFKRLETLFVTKQVTTKTIHHKTNNIEINFRISFNNVGNAYLTKVVRLNGVKNNDIDYLQRLVNCN